MIEVEEMKGDLEEIMKHSTPNYNYNIMCTNNHQRTQKTALLAHLF